MVEAKDSKVSTGSSYLELNRPKRVSMILSCKEKVGILADVLGFFSKEGLTLAHIESRPSALEKDQFDFFVDVMQSANMENMDSIRAGLENICDTVTIIGNQEAADTPWFPQKISDLDRFATHTLEFGKELKADHPGFSDMEYRKRRCAITENATSYKHGEKIPRVEYTDVEIETWGKVYKRLTDLYPTHACKEHVKALPLLEQYCGYGENNIPQLQDISDFLHSQTGFRLRPVAGLLSSRDFLNGLAFRVFHSTQYVRHHSQPFYTPEPDVAHELLGHVPLFADPDFAAFSQEIGLMSLGVSDADIETLATCYWFTIEFGLCREGDEIRAYGAGLLSSFGELEYCLTDKPKLLDFDPKTTSLTKYPVTEFQPTYFVAESFEDAKKKLKEFGNSLSRSFAVRYNPYTECVEVINSQKQLKTLAYSIHAEMDTLLSAMSRMAEESK
ncbi:phenylalanine-4-hydroxylase [Sphaeroforma arctica JP610]|uniref:phenylalanine 4-monooxygenase n=1 Tax=Sphaeroforma arctica JP610 TaxID=667725 RepID=A0A0L0G897_9EUKA|nr:phenylalanine-4-hydroxylase [Sphaeroforma arctica JP610]KNC85096.1 phenylalanine-4-hydroxylase [Sphaeroforma arctica JP610]|eukprot:XP_014158998.1 phenylalanine-4-hydroxylase [Sphaeroforma arctica JP610]